MDERRRFVNDWLSREWNVAELSRFYGISRPTAYKWLERFRRSGETGLAEVTRAPKSHPNATPAEMEAAVIQQRIKHPHWGPRKLRYCLERVQAQARWPSPTTIGEILKRHGLVAPRKRRRTMAPYPNPLSSGLQPNDVWAADFKGWFRTGDGTRIDPLTVSDVASRYLLRCQGVPKTDGETVRGQFTRTFQEYGLPRALRTDNGPPFASLTVAGLSRLSVWLIRLGIHPERIEPGRPDQNGVHERMHKTLKQETAKPPKSNPRAQQAAFDRFQAEFNDERPHEALGMRPPGDFYQPSARPFPNRLPEIEYPDGTKIYKVGENGCIHPKKTTSVFISNSLVGELVGLSQTNDNDWAVHFAWIRLGTYDSKRVTMIRV